jgi:L-lactate dehydrogenase complex protein LldG
MSDGRAAVLARVRDALGDATPPPEVVRCYRGAGGADGAADPGLVERFSARVAEYGVDVRTVRRADVDAAVAAACARRGARVVGVAPGITAPTGITAFRDEPPLSVEALDGLDGAVTGCALAIAETGTIVLDAGPRSGRRALTLVPDYHLCLVEAAAIVLSVPDAIQVLAGAARAGRPITLVSGPSATSDIELERVEGVHGPRTLDVIVIVDE